MLEANQTTAVFASSTAITRSQQVYPEAAAVPPGLTAMLPTSPSTIGSDLFYITIAFAVFTKVTIEAITLLVKAIVQIKASQED